MRASRLRATAVMGPRARPAGNHRTGASFALCVAETAKKRTRHQQAEDGGMVARIDWSHKGQS
jgi:hypothetical protein